MLTLHKSKRNIKAGLFFFVLFVSGPAFGQFQRGKVLSSETNSGIGYVNIGVVGKNIGTVSEEDGSFTIDPENITNRDSLRFSMIGYESKYVQFRHLKEDSVKNIYLKPRFYRLPELKVVYRKPKLIKLGTPVTSNALNSGFSDNSLGSEMAIKVRARHKVILKDINLNVATCTFDSVTYRLNIYQSVNKAEYKNILTEPIYIYFSKDKINNVVVFDLKKYSIIVEGDVFIALELYKDLGEGRLLFHTQFFTGTTYHRKTIDGKWIEAAGEIGMYLNGQLIR